MNSSPQNFCTDLKYTPLQAELQVLETIMYFDKMKISHCYQHAVHTSITPLYMPCSCQQLVTHNNSVSCWSRQTAWVTSAKVCALSALPGTWISLTREHYFRRHSTGVLLLEYNFQSGNQGNTTVTSSWAECLGCDRMVYLYSASITICLCVCVSRFWACVNTVLHSTNHWPHPSLRCFHNTSFSTHCTWCHSVSICSLLP